jgi:hypothetical protein
LDLQKITSTLLFQSNKRSHTFPLIADPKLTSNSKHFCSFIENQNTLSLTFILLLHPIAHKQHQNSALAKSLGGTKSEERISLVVIWGPTPKINLIFLLYYQPLLLGTLGECALREL